MLVALALACYATAGVLGHGLHALLPCADGCCGEERTACSCGHEHCLAAANLETSESDVPQLGRPGHDAETCSLCALLAKINVGYATFAATDVRSENVSLFTAASELRLPADLVLFSSARGPPVV